MNAAPGPRTLVRVPATSEEPDDDVQPQAAIAKAMAKILPFMNAPQIKGIFCTNISLQ
jgi:predicted xylose isomerase-like sugar epimerase